MSIHSADFLLELRLRLEEKGVPPESISGLMDLFAVLVTGIEHRSAGNQILFNKLVDAFAENGSLITLVQQQSAELDAFKRITLNLAASLKLEEVLEGVVKEALPLVKHVDEVQIYLYQDLHLVFSASLDSKGGTKQGLPQPWFDGLFEQVIKTREMLIIKDVQNHPVFEGYKQTWSGSIIALPLKIGDRLVGIMNLIRSQLGGFSNSEIRLMSMLADVASIAIINAQLHLAVSQQANFDVLTGMPNRFALEERLSEEIELALHTGYHFCVVMLDPDGFKHVNDTWGHEGGDEVLRQVACFLQKNLRSSDFIARYGGDEFTLILSATDLEEAKLVGEKISNRLANLEIHLPGGHSTSVSISGGIAIFPIHGSTPSGLIRAADEAMYRAKRSSPGSFQVSLVSDA